MADSTFKREIWFSPAFDLRTDNPATNRGVHGVDCTFAVSKDGQGVTFTMFTNWMLPSVLGRLQAPTPAGVDYHASKPQYEDHTCRDECGITGGPCFSGGSALLADEYFQTLLAEGSEGVFKRLEAQYETWLGGGEA
jgi:hypothetical protein